MATRGPKVATRRLQEAPRRLQDGPKGAQDGPRGPQDGSKNLQDGIIGAKLGAKMVPKMEIGHFQKTLFFYVFFNKNELPGGQNGAILGPYDVSCMT